MELRQLRYLDAVLATGTFAAAAEREHVSQPALWQQVRGLEAQWGIRLFDRVGRRVRPTRAAWELGPRVRAALDEAERVAGAVESIRAGIAVPARYIQPRYARSAAFMFEVLSRYADRFPDAPRPVAVDVGTASSLEAMESGHVDIAGGVPPPGWRFRSEPVYEVRLVALGADLMSPTVEVAELAGRPLAVLSPAYQSRQLLDAALRRSGVEPSYAIEHDSPEVVVAAARAGVAIAVLVSDAIDAAVDVPIAEVCEAGRGFGGTLCLLWRDDASMTPSARQLLGVAREVAAEVRSAAPAQATRPGRPAAPPPDRSAGRAR